MFTLAFATNLSAQVYVEFSTDTVLIGDSATLSVSVSNKGSAVIWPDLNAFKPFEVLKEMPADTTRKGKAIQKKYLVTTFDTGTVSLPLTAYHCWHRHPVLECCCAACIHHSS